jgi:hypothetical protein
LNIPNEIYLYNEGIKGLDLKGVKEFVLNSFGDIKIHFVNLKEKVVHTRGLLFDFIATQNSFAKTKYAKIKDACHIIITLKLFATFDQQKQIHIRAAIFGYPSIISLSGIVEGPAKPKEYYLYKQKYAQLKVWDIEEERVKKKFKGRFIDYEDKRMNKVLKGYIAQGIFFYLTGNPFCANKKCRLYNAHWQEDLIYSQIRVKTFCKRHQEELNKIKIQSLPKNFGIKDSP